jgi:hypothetical protein
MQSEQNIYFITVDNIETEQTMDSINEDFHKIGGMLDKVSKKLTDKQYKDLYDCLAEMKIKVENKKSESKFIKIYYSCKYIRFWYDDEEEKISKDNEYKQCVRIFQINHSDDDDSDFDYDFEENIRNLIGLDSDLYLDQKFLQIYIENRDMIDFDIEDCDDDTVYGWIKISKFEYL